MKTSNSLDSRFSKSLALSLALFGATGAAVSVVHAPALAQEVQDQTFDDGMPLDAVMPARTHMLRGTVAAFSPYRLLLAESPERTTQVDLKKGTAILPEGTSLTPGMPIAVAGHWSKGVFVADQVILRPDRD